jgi:alanine dehydrogenase
MAVQEGAKYLEKLYGGRGVLLGGVPGVPPAKVVILGGGTVGVNAAKMAAGLGAQVVILDLSLEKLRYLSDVMPANVQLIFSNRHSLLAQLADADLVIGAVLIPGALAPKLINREDQCDLALCVATGQPRVSACAQSITRVTSGAQYFAWHRHPQESRRGLWLGL